jgi:acyl-coenzyme A synthetase/AMP-(fatty) acid ligase
MPSTGRRAVTAVADLRRWRRDTPDSVAITAGRADSGTRHITYQEYAQYVERLTGALHELGVGPGQVVVKRCTTRPTVARYPVRRCR